MLFEDMVEGWFSDETVPYNDFLKAFLAKDLDYMNEYMNRVAEATFSTFDTGRNPSDDTNPERFYHGFVLGLIVELAGKYRVCLLYTSIRKSAIPVFWMENILWENCADDMYLWMLMFGEKLNISYNPEYLYTHVSTGENFSSNEKQTIYSEYKVIDLLRKAGGIKEWYLRFYAERLKIRNRYLFEIKKKWLSQIYRCV